MSHNAIPAFADSPLPQTSYKIEIDNSSKFFYMRGTDYIDDEENFLDLESGLYYSDSLENIYTIEPEISQQGRSYQRYVNQSSLVISQDGLYFANLPWTPNQGLGILSKSGVAIEFYKNGSLIKQYNLSDLTKNVIGFQYSVSHVSWEDYNKREFDAANNTLSITTLNNKTIVFDLTTGAIIKNKLSGGEIALIAVASVLCAALLAGIGLLIYKTKKKKAVTQNQ